MRSSKIHSILTILVIFSISLLSCEKSELKIIDDNGIHLDTNIYLKLHELDEFRIECISIDNDNNPIIGTLNGLVIWKNQEWNLFHKSNSGLPTNFIHDIAVDDHNNIWLATSSGLVYYDYVNWIVYNTLNTILPCDYIVQVEFDKHQQLWIVSGNDGLIKYDGINWTLFTTDNSELPTTTITKLILDREKELWAAVYPYLVLINNNKFVIYDHKKLGRIGDMAIDRQNKIIIGIDYHYSSMIHRENMLFRFDGKNLWTDLNPNKECYYLTSITLLEVDKNNNIYIADHPPAALNKLYKLKNEKIVEVCDFDNKCLWDIKIMESKRLWVGTSEGIKICEIP